MKVFSIILRILSLGACGFAVYCWIDKKDLVAQKEAVIQEREFLSGYYDKERSPNSEVKQDKTTRDANFAKINERGGSDSLKALKGLEDSLKTIQKADEYFGHEAKTLGGPDPNNQLTLKGHILVQTDKIETQKGIIEKKTQEISGLENDVKEKDTLLGEKITENGQLKGNIEDLNETIQEKDNKYAQLQTNYLDEQKNHQTQIENLQESLKTQTEELKVTLAAKEEKISETETKNQDLQIEVNRLRTQIRTPATATSGQVGVLTPGQQPNAVNPSSPSGNPNELILTPQQAFQKHVLVLGFNEKQKILAVNVGESHGIKSNMRMRLLRNGSSLARLGIVDVKPKYTLFQVLQNTESEEWQSIISLKKGDAVTIAE
ncbi:MAG: hypothetical protein HOD72_00495 [Opitutae bacterium]|nr:hypothetical protein [Opitutae bacterium]MBT5380456.1 hypothetical protein [Opitutae bacterium]MBT5691155.1 hypothetical protein [Opitutae bacterium]MBT6958782.1 hypothetical protein [Opitutae bacterium]MBT7853054.1 hypothetical protein [Opitutae bacterium]